MTKKEIAKLAQVIDAKYCNWLHPTSISDGDFRESEIIELITQMNGSFKGQQHKNPVRRAKRLPAGRTVTVTDQSGRKTLQSVKAVKLPEEV